MSGLHAIAPAVNPPENQYVKHIISVCAMHSVPCGAPVNLGAFLKALDTDKHMAMEFWTIVARLSDEHADLSIPAMNGTVLEVVMQAVTGRGVAEMIAAGREPRRLVGELGSLLAGEDLNSPLAIPIVEEPPVPDKVDAADSRMADVERLRADVEQLKGVFEAQFGGAGAAGTGAAGTGATGAGATSAISSHKPPAKFGETVLVEPQLAQQDEGSIMKPAIMAQPTQSALPVSSPIPVHTAPPAIPVRPVKHTVYAQAQALSSGQRARWEEPSVVPLPAPPIKSASALIEAPPPPPPVEPPIPTTDLSLITRPRPAQAESSLPTTEVALVPNSTITQAVVRPHPIFIMEAKPDALATHTPFDDPPVLRSQLHRKARSRRLVLQIAVLLLVLVALALFAQWWIQRLSNEPSETSDSSNNRPASSARPATHSVTPSGSALSLERTVPAVPGVASRTAGTKPDTAKSKTDQSGPLPGAPVRVAEGVKEDKPSPGTPISSAAIAKSAGPAASTAIPASPPAQVANAPPAKVLPASAAPRTTAAAVTPPHAPAVERTAPAPIVRASPPPETETKAGLLGVSSEVMAGTKIAGESPRYPAFAKSAHISGSVVLHAVITKTGAVEDLKIVSGPESLRESAYEAVKTWKYKPYLLNGEPSEVDTVIIVKFNMVN